MKLKSKYFRKLGSIRDVHTVTREGFDSFGAWTHEQWLLCIWHDRFGAYRVQARLQWYWRGPTRVKAPPAVVPSEGPSTHKSLAQARQRAGQLLLILGGAMGVRMRDHNGRQITIGYCSAE